MLSPDAGLSDHLEIPPDAYVERLQRRITALERQLDARIAQVEELKVRLGEHDGLAPADTDEPVRAWEEAEILRHKAAEYDALMNTFTMRALSRPRAWYASARRRLARP